MSAKLPSIWDADPHTIAKIAILKGYLQAWLRILGSTRKDETIVYVDGFAGPGRYRNHEEGSPLGALRVAASAITGLGSKFIAKQLHGAFIEKDGARFKVLEEVVAPFEKSGSLGVTKLCCEFADGIKELQRRLPGAFNGKMPLFIFADPFGGTGIPFRTFAECMSGDRSELLINLDADGIGRIFAADNEGRDDQLTELFGDESWRTELTTGSGLKRLSVEILDLYKKRLRSLSGVKHLWSFAMRGSRDAINYHLVFATKHSLGQKKMKEAMQALDRTGSYSFSDAHRDQLVLFRDDNVKQYAEALFKKFDGREVTKAEADVFALDETPFLDSNKLLVVLESDLRLQVNSHVGTQRRPLTYPEEKVRSLRFGKFGTKVIQTDLFS